MSALLVIAVSRATAAGGRAARWALIVALALGIACSGQKRSAKEKPARTAKTDAAHGKPDRERRTPALSRDAHEDVVISLDDDARDVQVEKAELYTRLRSLFLANNIGQIERELKAAEKKYPLRDDRDYHYYWGVVQERAGKLDDAVKSYARAIELSPNYSRARNALGKLYCRLKRYPEARVQYLLALEANPYNPFINYNLGSLYFEFNHLDVALKYLNNAAEYKKNFGSAYHKIGIIMYRKGQYQNAVINLSMAITFNKASHITFYYLGNAVGGAIGGFCASVIAPVIFNRVFEYPFSFLMVAVFFALFAWTTKVKSIRYAGIPLALVVAVFCTIRQLPDPNDRPVIYRDRG
ncbi:MAG TPA: tetratricopeptide repeat protein, partial [Spirochaetota bacterium]|nr:tetratricopeptide repeat protein [Spirochaetota bacterium]